MRTYIRWMRMAVVALLFPPMGWAAEYHINFGPSAVIPNGYVTDGGDSPIWSRPLTDHTQKRNINADLRLDSVLYSENNILTQWEFAVPNDTYTITVVLGDAKVAQGPHFVSLEGVTIANGQTTAANAFITVGPIPITVSDGKLSMSVGKGTGTSGMTALAYMDIIGTPTVPDIPRQLILRWTDNANNECGERVLCRLLSDPTGLKEVGRLEANATAFRYGGLTTNTYCCVVSAFNGAGESGPSNMACTFPRTPDSGDTPPMANRPFTFCIEGLKIQ